MTLEAPALDAMVATRVRSASEATGPTSVTTPLSTMTFAFCALVDRSSAPTSALRIFALSSRSEPDCGA
jgi:hypothetical protein